MFFEEDFEGLAGYLPVKQEVLMVQHKEDGCSADLEDLYIAQFYT